MPELSDAERQAISAYTKAIEADPNNPHNTAKDLLRVFGKSAGFILRIIITSPRALGSLARIANIFHKKHGVDVPDVTPDQIRKGALGVRRKVNEE